MTAEYTVRPISDRTWLRPEGTRVYSQFSATWSDTIQLLVREVFALQTVGMPDPVIEVDVRERDIRIDGGLRADAKAASPAVAVAFESKHGPLVYRCDRYVRGSQGPRLDHWQYNLRAIAKTLEALRAVDRYGATSSGEQYRGFKAIGDGSAPALDVAAARALIDGYGGVAAALRATHPDHGGNPDDFHRVQEARRLLGGGQ